MVQAEAQSRYAGLRDLPATDLSGTTIQLYMNAGLMADLPSLESSGAEGVGLMRALALSRIRLARVRLAAAGIGIAQVVTFDDVELAMGPVPALGQHTEAVLREFGIGVPPTPSA